MADWLLLRLPRAPEQSATWLIVDPRGVIVAGPLHEQHGILYADCDPAVASAAKRTLDVAGHYGRPDIFHLEVDRTPQAPVEFGAG